ncbi:phosphotransferase [Flexivirga oryzae]|uniref:Aminoglycoside phosphotransferase (APT) family kinase protein n=1 Tax=Flexivirga oryzae TaxID=1794944 RepID=A0A839N7S0_9MICO|nr:aminoglycoside phosphotransferase (APT) family kinase protein [Flexivirga oryzae]
MPEIEIVVAHSERTTLRVGNVFLKVDADPARIEHEIIAMDLAPIPTPQVLWHQPSVLALATVPGKPLGKLGEPLSAPPAAWVAAGATIRKLHEAPLPPWTAPGHDELAAELDQECSWLIAHDVLPAALVSRNRKVAEAALRPWTPAFAHGDLQIAHVFVDDNEEITGVLDWSEGAQGDPLYDLATLTLGHEERLHDLLTGYGAPVDLDVIRGWWSARSLLAARWLIEHGFDPDSPGCEFDVLRAAR